MIDRIMGNTCEEPGITEAQKDFRYAVDRFLNIIDPTRGRRIGGDVLRLLAKEFRDYATILDPQGDEVNLTSYTEQLDRVIRGKVAEALLEMMELLAGDRLATASARTLLANHLAWGDVPEHLKAYAWPEGVH